ncbi:MAG: heme ABC exporter ATP-binding protein CcmA [Terricaulis sp.]
MGAGRPFQVIPTIRVERLALARGGRTLFSGVSFEAASGAYVEVRGANGAGKTSLLRALAGFLKPEAGAIAFDGVEEPALTLHLLGHRDGLKSSIRGLSHVRYWSGLLGDGHGAVEAALVRVGLARIADLPARMLSQGQARRLSLARLLVAPRALWLLDEPVAGLDAAGKTLVADLIAAHRGLGGTVIAAAHEPIGPEPTHVVELVRA